MTAPVRARRGRVLEVLAVMLLGVATIGSAWCGYQATRWNGKETDYARESSDLQVEAAPAADAAPAETAPAPAPAEEQ